VLSTKQGLATTERRHGEMERHGCGDHSCTYAGRWAVAVPHYFASIVVYYTDRVVTGMQIKNSDGNESPLFGDTGKHAKVFSFGSGVCGITVAAGAAIDALVLKAREVTHNKYGLISCEEAFLA
jgi:hypothetical protein